MPFKSRKQWRAAMGGHIPGFSKSEARDWAHETDSFKKLPERAPAEKGKPTLRSQKKRGRTKKANGDMLQYFLDHPDKAEAYFERQRAKRAVFEGLEGELADVFKTAALGTATANPRNVGKLRGMMTTHALKAPGYAASTQAVNPRKSIVRAMNAGKPH